MKSENDNVSKKKDMGLDREGLDLLCRTVEDLVGSIDDISEVLDVLRRTVEDLVGRVDEIYEKPDSTGNTLSSGRDALKAATLGIVKLTERMDVLNDRINVLDKHEKTNKILLAVIERDLNIDDF